MGSLKVVVQSINLFSCALIDGDASITPTIKIQIEGGDASRASTISAPGPGRTQTVSANATLTGVKQRDRLQVSIVSGERLVGRCVVSLARLIRSQLRNRMHVLVNNSQDGTPFIAGYIHIGLLSNDVGVNLADNEADEEELLKQYLQEEANESVLHPRLVQLLLAKDPHLLLLADVILSEGPEFNKHDESIGVEHINDMTLDKHHEMLVGDADRSPRAFFIQTQLSYDCTNISFQSVGVAVKTVAFSPSTAERKPKAYSVSVTSAHEELATRQLPFEPVINYGDDEQQMMGLIGGVNPEFQITLADESGFTIASTIVGLGSVYSSRPCLREFPVLDKNGDHHAIITLELYTEDFGEEATDEEEKNIRNFYKRITAFLKKYDAKKLLLVDHLAVENRNRQEEYLKECEIQYGYEPGTVYMNVSINRVERLKLSNDQDDLVGSVGVSGSIVCMARVPFQIARTAPCRYTHHCATYHHKASPMTLEAHRDTDTLEVVVVSADNLSQTFGRAYIPCVHIQKGVNKSRRYPLFTNAGTTKAFVSGYIDITLFTTQRGKASVVDTGYETFYAAKTRQLLIANEIEKAHTADAIVADTMDMEMYLMKAEKRFEVPHSRTAPRLTVRVKKGQGLPSGHNVRVVAALGTQTFETNPSKSQTFKGTPFRYLVEYPTDAALLVYLQDKDTHAELGRVVIPITTIEANSQTEKWFTVTSRGTDRGEILLVLTTENCGGETIAIIDAPIAESEDDSCDVAVTDGDSRVRGDAALVDVTPIEVTGEDLNTMGDTYAVTIASIQSLSRGGRIENPVRCFVKLVLRDQSNRTSVVEGNGRDLQFGSKYTFQLQDASDKDVLFAYVYGTDEDDVSHLFGITEINISRLYKGRTREAVLPIVANAKMEEAEMCGLLTIRLHCKTNGLDVPAEGEPVFTPEETQRLRNFYVKYLVEELHRFDFHVDPALGFNLVMGNNVRKYGPEPNTCLLQLTVATLDAPHLLHVSNGYSVAIQIGKRTHETKSVATSNPEFHESFDFPVDLSTDEIITLIVSYGDVEYGRCLMSIKNIPNKANKNRTVYLVAQPGNKTAFIRGTITVGCYTNDFGCKSIPSDESEKEYRSRIISILQRFAPEELHRIELMLGDNVGSENELLTSLISKYGVPGDAMLAVTVTEVRGLQRNGKTVIRGDPYVKVKTSMEKSRTKTVKYYKHAYFDENFTFDLAHPEKDVLVITVYNDDLGVNHKYGEVMISLARLQRGVSRQINAMIVQHAGTKHACPGGYVTLVLRSDDFGRKKAIQTGKETIWHNRLKYYFLKYSPEKLHLLDVICSTTMADPEKHMEKLVKAHGPEPPTHTIVVTVDKCMYLPQVREDVSVTLSRGIDTFVTRAVQPDGRTLHLNEKFIVNISNPQTDELTFSVDSRSDKLEYSRVTIPVNSCTQDVETTYSAFLFEDAGTKDAKVAGLLIVKLHPIAFGVPPAVSKNFSKEVYTHAREKLERLLTQNNPADLHRMECLLASHAGKENKLVPSLLPRYPVITKHAPTTIRVCKLQSSIKGTFSIRCSVNDRSIIKSKPSKFERDNERVFIQEGSVVTDTVSKKYSELCFTLTSHSTFSSTDVAECYMDLAHCTIGAFNERRLGFFGKQTGEEIAAVWIDVRSLEIGVQGDPSVTSSTQEKWKGVERDVVSVLQTYSPKDLAKLDSIVRSAPDVDEIHGDLLHKYNPKAMVTVFLERVVVNVPAAVYKDLRKHSDATFVATIGNTVVSNPLVRCQALNEGGENSATIVEYRANQEMSIRTDSFSRHLGSSLSSPTTAASFSIAARVLRLDLNSSQVDNPMLNVRLEAGGRVWGQFNVSLLALFLSYVDVYTVQEFPLIGTLPRYQHSSTASSPSAMSPSASSPRRGTPSPLTIGSPSKRSSKFNESISARAMVIGSVSISFSYPYLQAIPQSLIRNRSFMGKSKSEMKNLEESKASALKNKRYINYYYQRTLDYLLEHDVVAATHLHGEYFDMVSRGQWEEGCKSILEKHVNQIGFPETAVGSKPPEKE